MTAEVARTKQRRHVAAYENAMHRTRVHVGARVSARVRTCVCLKNEITFFLGFSLSHYVHMPYILVHSLSFLSCGNMFLFEFVQMMWWDVERSMHELITIIDRYLSEGVRGALWFVNESFYNDLVSFILPRSYIG